MAATVKKTGSKKSKRNVPNGVVHIQSTFNNTIVSISDTSGQVISWSSAGASGFKGARKGTPFAAQTAAEAAARRALDQGMRQIEVLVVSYLDQVLSWLQLQLQFVQQMVYLYGRL